MHYSNLVAAALQRGEALGWLGLEVKRDRLRGKVGAGGGCEARGGALHACAGSSCTAAYEPSVSTCSAAALDVHCAACACPLHSTVC